MATRLGFYVSLSISYDEALEKVVAALKSEGFGVLTRIDVKATLLTAVAEEARIRLERVARALQLP